MADQNMAKKPRNWTRIALIGSLAVNFVVIGLVIGALARFDRMHGDPLDRVSMGLGLYISALPEEARQSVREAGGPMADDRRVFFKEMRMRHKALETVLLAKPFSAEDVRKTILENRAFAIAATQRVQDSFVDALEKMAEPERDAYFERVKELREARKERREDRRKNRDR